MENCTDLTRLMGAELKVKRSSVPMLLCPVTSCFFLWKDPQGLNRNAVREEPCVTEEEGGSSPAGFCSSFLFPVCLKST